jgi:hypothetical protein
MAAAQSALVADGAHLQRWLMSGLPSSSPWSRIAILSRYSVKAELR